MMRPRSNPNPGTAAMRWPALPITSLLIAALVIVLLPLTPRAASIADFAGAWEGAAVGTDRADGLMLTLTGGEHGFHVAWTELGAEAEATSVEAGFQPSGRENVFSYAPEAGSLLSRMFAAPATGNPLAGETLLWARLEAETLTLYSLAIEEDGSFKLDQYRWTLDADGLALRFSQRMQALEEIVIEGRLQPAGE
jgi:hypothetical protein